MGLLPPAATDTTRVVKDSSLGQAQEASNPLGTSGTSEALAESAITSRDLWLCHRLSTTFSELHVLFLQRIARSFTNLVMELSQSRLAALLRQHQVRKSSVLPKFIECFVIAHIPEASERCPVGR